MMQNEDVVVINALYKHYKGGIYRVLLTAVNEVNGEPVVAYVDAKTGMMYVRPLEAFLGNTEDGERRFDRLVKSKYTIVERNGIKVGIINN